MECIIIGENMSMSMCLYKHKSIASTLTLQLSIWQSTNFVLTRNITGISPPSYKTQIGKVESMGIYDLIYGGTQDNMNKYRLEGQDVCNYSRKRLDPE